MIWAKQSYFKVICRVREIVKNPLLTPLFFAEILEFKISAQFCHKMTEIRAKR